MISDFTDKHKSVDCPWAGSLLCQHDFCGKSVARRDSSSLFCETM